MQVRNLRTPSQVSATRRASLGLARTGAISGNGSGGIFIALSTANANAAGARDVASVPMLANDRVSAVFAATVRGLRSCRMRA